MKKYSYEYPHFAVTVDNVILNLKNPMNPKVLLITRKNEPYKGCFALPGGFLDPEDRSALAGAVRELKEETNLSLSFLNQICTLTKEGRDPRERCISIVYAGYIIDDQVANEVMKAQDDASTVQWVSLVGLRKNKLAFDHENAIWKTLATLFRDDKDITALFDVSMNEVQPIRTLLNTIRFNLGETTFPVL